MGIGEIRLKHFKTCHMASDVFLRFLLLEFDGPSMVFHFENVFRPNLSRRRVLEAVELHDFIIFKIIHS